MQVTPREARRHGGRKRRTELVDDASAEISRRGAEDRHLLWRLGHSASKTERSGEDVRSDGALSLISLRSGPTASTRTLGLFANRASMFVQFLSFQATTR